MPEPVLVTRTGSLPVTIAAIKRHARITSHDDDAVILTLAEAAREGGLEF